jgi:RNA polymerase sigma factor (sigma-70 family)
VSFRPRPDHELAKLDDEKLIAYLREAASAGDAGAARSALATLTYGYLGNIRGRVRLRIPPHAVDDVVSEVLVRAIGAAFDGSSVGEFRSWLSTITKRGIADWHRRQQRRPKETPLPTEHVGSEEIWGGEPASESEAGAVEFGMVLDGVLGGLSERHRLVVELHLFDGFSAAEVCEQVDGMKPDNVAQIASRFRKRLEKALPEGGGGGP